MEEKKYELIKFNDGEFSLDVNVSPSEDTVWLTKEQIAILFDRNRTVISKHISNIYREGELDRRSICAKNAHVDKYEYQKILLSVFPAQLKKIDLLDYTTKI